MSKSYYARVCQKIRVGDVLCDEEHIAHAFVEPETLCLVSRGVYFHYSSISPRNSSFCRTTGVFILILAILLIYIAPFPVRTINSRQTNKLLRPQSHFSNRAAFFLHTCSSLNKQHCKRPIHIPKHPYREGESTKQEGKIARNCRIGVKGE